VSQPLKQPLLLKLKQPLLLLLLLLLLRVAKVRALRG
jgi:hypothetical protein